MLIFLTQAHHTYTLSNTIGKLPFVKIVPYDALYTKRYIPSAVYVFTDFDRMSFWELELAGRLYRVIRESGCPVLNNPAIVKQRFALLKTLKQEGINQFGVYRPSAGEWPEKYPVFVRRDCFHEGTLTDLIYDRETLEEELVKIQEMGIPDRNTMVAEYAAAPTRDDIFIKYAVYKFGDSLVTDSCVTERNWVVKYGQLGCMREQDFIDERERVKTVEHETIIRKAFELANIEYGRVDYGLLDGVPQIYEINTNPDVRFYEDQPTPVKQETREIIVGNMKRALQQLADQHSGSGKIKMKDSMLRWQYKNERLFQRSRPTR